MKKTILPFLLLATIALSLPYSVSCTKNPPDDPGENKPEPEAIKLEPGIYTFSVPPLKGKWEAGDQIYVHGSYGPKAEVVTLAAADISADGLTASARLEVTTAFPVLPDGLYAAWPAEAVPANDGLMTCTIDFEKTDIPLAVAYLSGTHFEFTDASAGLSFEAPGYDEFALATNDRIGMRFNGFEVEYTTEVSAFYGRKSDGYPFLRKPITDGSVLIWLPGNFTFSSGYTIYLGKDNHWTECYTVNDNIKFSKGKITDLGNITTTLQPYNGPEPKMPEMGKRTKYMVVFNELSGLCLSADKSFLWGVDDDGGLGQFSLDGKVKMPSKWIGGEFEAITLDPTTGDLLIGEETSPAKVTRITAPEYDFNTATEVCKIAGTTGMGNSGLEGLTYYKDGMAYAGMQTGSYLYLFKLETGEVIGERKNLRETFPAITEIGDLCYDPLTDWLWIIDSEARKIFAMSGDAETLFGYYSVKGIDNPEAVCIDHEHSCIWVGDDHEHNSYLYKFEFTGLDDAIIH